VADPMLSDEEQVSPKPLTLLLANLSLIVSNLLEAVFERVQEITVIKAHTGSTSIEHILSSGTVDVTLLGLLDDQSAGSAAQMLEALRKLNPRTRFLVLIEKPTYAQTIALFRAGANGIIVGEELTFELLCRSVRCIQEGHVWANNDVQKHLVASLAKPRTQNVTDSKAISLLTNRELEVLRLLADGLSNSELASTLRLSEHTIKNHLFRIYEKLGVSNRMEAVLYFLTSPTWPNQASQQTGTY
jgi:DNA-binding NarL/FixJ family response regulator